MASKNFIIIAILVVLVLLGLGIWLGFSLNQSNSSGASPYSAVYLSTGDIYFGSLSWFPWPHLTNVLLLQRQVGQNNQPQLSIGQLSGAFWGPVDEVYLNPKQIIFWTRLRNDSQIVRVIQNPNLLQQQPATSTFRGPSGPPPK